MVGLIARDIKWILFLRDALTRTGFAVGLSWANVIWIKGGVFFFGLSQLEHFQGLLRIVTHVHGQNTGYGDDDGYFDSRPKLMLSRLQLR